MTRTRPHHEPSVGDDLMRWLAFGVGLGLLPVLLRFLYLRTQVPLTTGFWFTVQSTLATGDLLLITCCIGGAALGNRVGRAATRPRTEILLSMACQVTILASMFFYALTFMRAIRNAGVVATASCLLFILTVLTSAPLMFISFIERCHR
jgi:hypothetical protein